MKSNYKDANGFALNKLVQSVPEVGILEWFHLNDYNHVESAVKSLKSLNVKHLRTGFSWADYYTDDGQAWFEWLIPHLAEHFTILPCFLYTPPSIAQEPKASAPPKNPKDYADFIDIILSKYGQYFDYVELWNEPNNQSEYDYLLDDNWETFINMIGMASYWAKHLGKKTVLGGMSPIDPNWLKMMAHRGALEYIDVIGIHGFPDVFDPHWKGWSRIVLQLYNILLENNLEKEIWITETGYSTWKYDEKKQLENFLNTLKAPVERVYWYSLTDLSQDRETVDGYHMDDREYHFGLLTESGSEKLLYRLWKSGGIQNIKNHEWIVANSAANQGVDKASVLITGGAGFIGTNLADRLLKEGHDVIIYDNLSRPGVEKNLEWLRKHHPNLKAVIADVRDYKSLEEAVNEATHVFHFAAQVAVTSSLMDPVYDFEVNLKGTLNLLEAIRRSNHQPSLIFTSTNKVYGDLEDIKIRKNTTRYYPKDSMLEHTGIGEDRRLDFHSPYGSSKGAADQYILDYTRSFGLKNIVFRMSCIYGPHQFGTEDQGWVAHFIIKALKNEQITLYGDGMQVRDILYVEDLVNAFMLAWKNIDELKGEVFNMGGGPDNVISLLELIDILESYQNEKIKMSFEDWRKGDQKYYVSDYRKFNKATGWLPHLNYKEGIDNLYNWLVKNGAQNNVLPSSLEYKSSIFK